MRSSRLSTKQPLRLLVPSLVALGLVATTSTGGLAFPGEDALVCARIKDSYTRNDYVAGFWPRSENYEGMDITTCKMKVRAVEHCVPAQIDLYETSAPFETCPGPDLRTEYTCYKIRCTRQGGTSFLGDSLSIEDTFGARSSRKPRVRRVCLPNPS